MTTSEKATQKSITPSRSVHPTSFFWALCHELVLSTTHRLVAQNGADSPFLKSSHLGRIERADERTRTADLISLRVISHALQGFARACKPRLDKLVSFLCLATCCTVLRSRWCQKSVVTRRWLLCSALSSFPCDLLVTLDRTTAGALRSRPPPETRPPHRSRALRLAGRCRCARRATRPER
jgi:hypothetical protein